MKYGLSASLICGNPLKIFEDLEELEKAHIDFLHFDVMDGHFVPRIGLYPEMLNAIKKQTKIPIDVHLMVEEPEKYIPTFINAGADYVTIHAEANGNLTKNLKLIRDSGAKTGVALKIETDPSILDELLPNVDLILLMAIHPGILGQKMLPGTLERIKVISDKTKEYSNILLEIDGGVTPETAFQMIEKGANLLVCGSGTIYRPQEGTLSKKIEDLRTILK